MTLTNKIALIGKPGEFSYKEEPVPTSKDNSIVIKNYFAGVNYADVFQLKRTLDLTGSDILGIESVGEVTEVGKNITQFKVGDRVVSTSGANDANYTEIPSNLFPRVTKLPDDISYETAIGLGLQALTAYTLAFKEYQVQKDDYLLVYAAAGGVGIILTQLLANLGGKVIGVVSSKEKSEIVLKFGAQYVIDHSKENIAERVMEITGGKGVHAVYDSVGKAVFDASVDSLRQFGYLIHYGYASGRPDEGITEKVFLKCLRINSSIFPAYQKEGDAINEWWYKLFDMVRSGSLKTYISKTYNFDQIRQALDDIENRKSTGKLMIRI